MDQKSETLCPKDNKSTSKNDHRTVLGQKQLDHKNKNPKNVIIRGVILIVFEISLSCDVG